MKLFLANFLCTLFLWKFPISRAALNVVKWNKYLGEFETISGISSHEIQRRKTELQNERQESFNGQPLHLTYFEDHGFFEFHDNNTRVTGVFGDIYNILAEYLNFTLVLSNSGNMPLGVTFSNGSYSGILEYARLNKTDVIPRMPVYVTRLNAVRFAPALWMNSLQIFALGNWKRNYSWMFTIFPIQIWGFIGLSVMVLGAVSFTTEKVLMRQRGQQLRSRPYSDHLFGMYFALCNQLNGIDTIASRSKMLAITTSMFCWLILTVYSSYLIQHMTQETFDAPFNDLETLFEKTNFHVAILENSIAETCFTSAYSHEIFIRFWEAKRVKISATIEQLFRQVCFNSEKYVLFDAEDAMAARKNMICNLFPIGSRYYVVPVASGISKGLKNKKSLDIGFLKLNECGIIDAIKKRYMSPPKQEVGQRVVDSLVISMNEVLAIFWVLVLGTFASIIICVAENMVLTFKNRRTIQSLTQRLSTIRRPLFGSNVDSSKCN